jgi:tRNA-intron endonuclease
MRKRLMLAIVDEESDITFYEAREKDLSGRMREEGMGGAATLLEDRVVLWDPEASRLLHQHGFYGKSIGDSLQLSLVESAYLLEKGMIFLSDRRGAAVDLEGLKARARQIEEGFDLKYQVYKDLRDRKLVVKTGFKFGTHFRVYKRVESHEKVPHSEYLVHALPEEHIFFPPALSRAVRLANSVRKEMVFAYPGRGVSYLEISRLKP